MRQYQVTITVQVLASDSVSGDEAADFLDELIYDNDYAEFEVLNTSVLGIKEVE